MQMMLANTSSQALTYNATYDDLSRPNQGPANPFKPDGPANGLKRKNGPVCGRPGPGGTVWRPGYRTDEAVERGIGSLAGQKAKEG